MPNASHRGGMFFFPRQTESETEAKSISKTFETLTQPTSHLYNQTFSECSEGKAKVGGGACTHQVFPDSSLFPKAL